MAGLAHAEKPLFDSLADAFTGPRARYFGVNGDGSPKDAHTYYRANTPNLIYEVSNGTILAAVDRNGLVVNVVAMQAKDNWPGSSSFPFGINFGTGEIRLDKTANIGVDLLGGFFPVHTFNYESLRMQQLIFAPDLPGADSERPGAIIVVFRADNRGQKPVSAMLRVKQNLADVSQVKDGSPRAKLETDCYPRYPERKKQFKAGYQAVACLGDTDWKPAHPDVEFAVPAGGTVIITLALMVGDTPEDVSASARLVRRHTVLEWLNGTWAIHAGRVGRLSVPDDPYYSELYTRLVEETCNSTLISRDGKATNTDAGEPLLSVVDPVLAARVLRVPGYSRLDDFNSLYACLWAVWQRAIYYQATGDTLFFRNNPGEMERARDAFNDALAHKSWDSPFLFPGRYIWDGLARGDWHTGSNIILWHCWKQWSRIARDVYGDRKTADEWEGNARRLKDAIEAHCIGKGEFGPQYFEGGYRDGSFSKCHDGEEVASSYAPFLGFCEVDDQAMLNYKRSARTLHNPLYAQAIDGVYWLDGEEPFSGWWGGVTFPGSWPVGLAAATSETEVKARLERIRGVTDLDGSFWWWPYTHGATDVADVRRRDGDADVGKTAYASSLFCVLFINKIIGLSVDAPARTVVFRPFCPWDRFGWEGCRFGNALFDVTYTRKDGQIQGEIVNRNGEDWEGTVELILPEGCASAVGMVNGRRIDGELVKRYGRAAYRSTGSIGPNGKLCFTIEYEGRRSDGRH